MRRFARIAVIAFTMGLAQGLTGVGGQHAQAGDCDHAPGSNCRCSSSNYGLLDALDQVADGVLKDSAKHTSILSLLSRRSTHGCTGGSGCAYSGHQAGKSNCDCGSCCDARQTHAVGQNPPNAVAPQSAAPSRLRQVPVQKMPSYPIPSQPRTSPAVPSQPQQVPPGQPEVPYQAVPGAIPTPLPSDATTDPFQDDTVQNYRHQSNMRSVADANLRGGAKHYSFYRQINPQSGVMPARRRISSIESDIGQGSEVVVLSEFSSRRGPVLPQSAAVAQVVAAAVDGPMPGLSQVITSSAIEPPRLPANHGPAARPIINIDPDEISSRNPLRKR